MIRLMRVHVCRYCCINYSLAISISLRKSVFFPYDLIFVLEQSWMSTTWRTRNESSPPAKPHKSMPADFYRPITHRVIAVWTGRLSCQQCHWTGCAVVCSWDWMWMRKRGGFRGPFHCVGLTDRWTARRPGSERQRSNPCSAVAAGHIQDLEKIRESDSICFPSLFPRESKGKTFPAVPPDWVRLT